MIFRRSKKTVKKSVSSMDKLITGIVIWGAAASIFGLSRTKKWRKISEKIFAGLQDVSRFSMKKFWKITVKILDIFSKK